MRAHKNHSGSPAFGRSTSATRLIAAIGLAAGTAALGAGETITVTTLNDTFNIGGAQQVGDLPGGDGLVSMREAVAAANNTPGPQTIEFAIPQSEFWLDTSMALLRIEDGAFQLNDDGTTIDFTTQTDHTGDTNPNGWEVGAYGLQPNAWGVAAIFVNGNNCTIKGLGRVLQRGSGVTITGSNNRVIGCTISGPLYAAVEIETFLGSGTNATNNVIGGTLPEERNILSAGNAGVRIDGASYDNIVIGNTIVGSPFAGVEVRGAYCCEGYTPVGNRIGGPTPEEANWIANNGKYGEEGFPLGDQVRVEYAIDTTIEGNLIGTTEAGDAAHPTGRGTVGVAVRVSDDTVIRDNTIAGIRRIGVNHAAGQVFGVGVAIYGECERTTVQGNRIGVGLDGVTPILSRSSLSIGSFPGEGSPIDTLIGGEAEGDGNTIAHAETFGVAVVASAQGTGILGNSIHSHGGLGIDIGTAGPSPSGVPTLSSATGSSSELTVTGTLAASPGTTYRIEFFANSECDPSGFGEGETFLGFVETTTNAGGAASFEVELAAAVEDGDPITATATSLATGATSEFSACIGASVQSLFGDIDGDGAVGFPDLNLLLSEYGSSGAPGASPCDLNDDGAVNFADLNMLLELYGQTL